MNKSVLKISVIDDDGTLVLIASSITIVRGAIKIAANNIIANIIKVNKNLILRFTVVEPSINLKIKTFKSRFFQCSCN